MRRNGPGVADLWDQIAGGAAAAARLEMMSATAPALRPIRVSEVLSSRRGKSVLAATVAGQPVVVAVHDTPDPARLQAEAAALMRLAPRFAEGANRLVGVVGCWPDLGVLAVTRAPGERLGAVLEGPERGAHLARAGAWAAHLAAGAGQRPFQPEWWLGQARAVPDNDALSDADRAGLAALDARLAAMAQRLAGRPVGFGPAHGDLTPANLMWDGAAIWGIDMGSGADLPLALDAARFLCVAGQGAGALARDGNGLVAGDAAAFGHATDDPAFAFFCGLELLRRIRHQAHRPARIAPLRAALDAVLAA